MPSSTTAGLKQPTPAIFFTGLPIGTCHDTLDTACGLYRTTPTAWT